MTCSARVIENAIITQIEVNKKFSKGDIRVYLEELDKAFKNWKESNLYNLNQIHATAEEVWDMATASIAIFEDHSSKEWKYF